MGPSADAAVRSSKTVRLDRTALHCTAHTTLSQSPAERALRLLDELSDNLDAGSSCEEAPGRAKELRAAVARMVEYFWCIAAVAEGTRNTYMQVRDAVGQTARDGPSASGSRLRTHTRIPGLHLRSRRLILYNKCWTVGVVVLCIGNDCFLLLPRIFLPPVTLVNES